jgi:hypothetical protein
MKKIFFIMAAVMLSTIATFAQHAVGTLTVQPRIGFNIASMTKSDGADPRFGLALGGEFEYQATDIVGFSGGLIYSMQGCTDDESGIDMTLKTDYINVPLLANVYIAKNFAVKFGIQPGFNVSSKMKASGGGASIEIDTEDFGVEAKTVDFSIPIGLSYEYKNFVFDARYNFGLTKMYDVDWNKVHQLSTQLGENFYASNIKSKNSVFQFTIGYKFEL